MHCSKFKTDTNGHQKSTKSDVFISLILKMEAKLRIFGKCEMGN